MFRVAIKPELIRWAVKRSGKDEQALHKRFPKLLEWEGGQVQPTWNQLQQLARATYTPVGYLFFDEPPDEPLPIADLRTIADRGVTQPSPNLLETIYLCQQRQAWFTEYSMIQNHDPFDYVGSAAADGQESTAAVAQRMRQRLGFDVSERASVATFEYSFRAFVDLLDAAGILVMISGIVGSNTHRKLDINEFRGFALADKYAPLIFINGNSSKSAQMFTLAHELAHIWLGSTALTDAEASVLAPSGVERWCNQVAAEFLVPSAHFVQRLNPGEEARRAMKRLAREFKVSTLVILRRMHEVGILDRSTFWNEYEDEVARLLSLRRDGAGGNYYRTQPLRISKRFARAVIVDTLEGHTLYRDAMNLIGTKNVATLHELGHSLGVGP